MSSQPSLFGNPPRLVPTKRPKTTLDGRFDDWAAENPEIVELFLRYAREARASGRHYGIKAIAERVRWHVTVEKREDYKINNSYMSRLSRLLVRVDPDLVGLFEFRKLKS